MPALDRMPRTRRRRLATGVGLVLTLIGGAMVAASLRTLRDLHPIGFVSIGILLAGVALGWWGMRSHATAVARDQQELTREGVWDGLPAGTYEDQGRIGLKTMRAWSCAIPALGLIMLALGALIAFPIREDRGTLYGGLFVMALGVLMLVVTALVAGTVYWLDPDGIRRARSGSGVRWLDITEVSQDSREVRLHTDGSTFTIATGALEISQPDLVRLVEGLREHARVAAAGPTWQAQEREGTAGTTQEEPPWAT